MIKIFLSGNNFLTRMLKQLGYLLLIISVALLLSLIVIFTIDSTKDDAENVSLTHLISELINLVNQLINLVRDCD